MDQKAGILVAKFKEMMVSYRKRLKKYNSEQKTVGGVGHNSSNGLKVRKLGSA